MKTFADSRRFGRKRSKSAFTLIEMSIVLVIIGLVVGGVLAGRTLVKAAEVRAEVSQISSLDGAVTAFRGKYEQLPGDISNAHASAFGLYVNWMGGNENGLIDDGGYPVTSIVVESYIFFIQLASANLIGDVPGKLIGTNYGEYACGTPTPNYLRYVGCQFPQAKLGNGGFIATSLADGRLAYFLAASATAGNAINNNYNLNVIAVTPVVVPADAYALDVKMDDGAPLTGRISSYTVPIALDSAAGNCITTVANNSYNLAKTSPACDIMVTSSR